MVTIKRSFSMVTNPVTTIILSAAVKQFLWLTDFFNSVQVAISTSHFSKHYPGN